MVSGAPDGDEDLSGVPVVGRSGEVLDSMLGALGLGVTDVYVCSALKCWAPGDRFPDDAEIEAAWRVAMWAKAAGHGINDPSFVQPDRPMSAIGG